MHRELVLYTFALGLSVLTTSVLAVAGFLRRRTPGAGAFIGLVLAAAFYSFGSIFEIRSTSADELLIWLSIEYLGIATMGPLWLLLSNSLATGGAGPSRPWIALGFAIPLLVIVAVFTNDLHHLYYTSIVIERRGTFVVPHFGKGPIYWVNFAYMNLSILAGTILIFRFMLGTRGAFRRQALVLVAGAIIPWIGMLIYQTGLSPYGLDIAPFGLTLSGILFGWALFRYQLLDLSPVAHRKVFEGLVDAVLVADTKGRILAVNPAMASVFPGASADFAGKPASELLATQPALLSLLDAEQGACIDIEVEGAAGMRHYEAVSSGMLDRRGRRFGTILTLRDISLRVELHEKVERVAVTDELTGVPNRRRLIEIANRELERSKRYKLPLALAIMDLDHFKTVNDVYGHLAGDAVLATTARECAARLRSTDFFGRFGGEEFIVVLPDSPAKEASASIERLRVSIEALRFTVPKAEGGCDEIGVTASFGLTFRECIGEDDLASLLHEADRALYRAKAEGRNRVVTVAQDPSECEDV